MWCLRVPNRYWAFTGFKCATLLHGPSKTFKPKKENSGFYIAKKAEFAVLKCAFTINVRWLNDDKTLVCPENQALPFPVGTGSSDGSFCHAKQTIVISITYSFGISDALDGPSERQIVRFDARCWELRAKAWFHDKRHQVKNKTGDLDAPLITVTGLVIPVSWDGEGNPCSTSIHSSGRNRIPCRTGS